MRLVKKGKMLGRPAWLIFYPDEPHRIWGYRRNRLDAMKKAAELVLLHLDGRTGKPLRENLPSSHP